MVASNLVPLVVVLPHYWRADGPTKRKSGEVQTGREARIA
jgi:hypothetical protein